MQSAPGGSPNSIVPLRRPNIMDRRELLGVLGAAGLVAVIDLTAHARHDGQRGQVYDDCLKACEACERSCNETFHFCYTQVAAGKKEYARGYGQELCLGIFQAAGFSLMPSMNLVPRTTSASSGDPFNDRQPFDALSINLNTIVRHATRPPLPLVSS